MNVEELYQEVVLEHSKRPRNFGLLPGATTIVRGDNPSCGDEITLAVKLASRAIDELKFTGHGCAICMASASLMTLKMRGKSFDEARAAIGEAFRRVSYRAGTRGTAAPLWRLAGLRRGAEISPTREMRDAGLAGARTGAVRLARTGCNYRGARTLDPPGPRRGRRGLLYFLSSKAAWAAARRAMGTRNGEQLTLSSPMAWQNLTLFGSPPCSPQVAEFDALAGFARAIPGDFHELGQPPPGRSKRTGWP